MTTAACPTDRSARSCVTLPPAQALPLSATFHKLLRPIAIFPRPVPPICRHPYTSREAPPSAKVVREPIQFPDSTEKIYITQWRMGMSCPILFHHVGRQCPAPHRNAMPCAPYTCSRRISMLCGYICCVYRLALRRRGLLPNPGDVDDTAAAHRASLRKHRFEIHGGDTCLSRPPSTHDSGKGTASPCVQTLLQPLLCRHFPEELQSTSH